MVSKLLALGVLVFIVLKLAVYPQFKNLGKWLNGVVNALLIAIGVAWSIQLLIWLTSRG